MKIALDAMGGDSAPACTVAGAWEALKKFPDIEIILVGDQARIEQELRSIEAWPMDKRFTIHHASQVVAMSDNATDAVRRKKDSSISRATELLAKGGAEALVSAGHTGALGNGRDHPPAHAARRGTARHRGNDAGDGPPLPGAGCRCQCRLRPGASAPLRHHGLGLFA